MATAEQAIIIGRTREWLEKVVIGLNLCPFAHAVHGKNLLRFSVSEARDEVQLIADLKHEMFSLARDDPQRTETTLLIHPWVLTDFLNYNDFLDIADETLEQLDLAGVLQIASFHPHYQFADSAANAIENYSNRSPYPMLHLLREASVSRAVDAHPDVHSIPVTNSATLRKLGHHGWKRLGLSLFDKPHE